MQYGARGQTPVVFECSYAQSFRLVNHIPGVAYHATGVACAWDVAPVVARMLEVPAPPKPSGISVDTVRTALAATLDTSRPPRVYQYEDAAFLGSHAYALLCNPMRSGKTLEALMAMLLTGSKRVLVLCPSISKWVWADEIAKWLKQPAMLLDGLSCSSARRYCMTCMQRGRTLDGTRCKDCSARNRQSYGYSIIEIRETEPPTKRAATQYATSDWRCRRHLWVTSPESTPQRCAECKVEMMKALKDAPFVVCNYDLLTPHASRDSRGRLRVDAAMRGWGDVLAALSFDHVILDESHYLRSFDRDQKARRDRVAKVVRNAKRVWGITGTPIFGYVRDLWSQLDLVSGGLFGTFDQFTKRYCDGRVGEYGWEANGRSNEAELAERLACLKIQRPRSEILPFLPRKQRIIHRLDAEVRTKRRLNGSARAAIPKLIEQLAPIKRPHVVANVLADMAEGLKTYVLTYRRNACEAMAKAIETEMNKREWRQRMRSVNAEIWVGQDEDGLTSKARFEAARGYREHEGAAVFVATIDSMPGSLNLKGASTVHVADLHWSPAALEQAEDRPYDPESRGLTVVHYIVRNSIDEDIEAIVLAKFATKDALLNDETSREVIDAFRQPTEQESLMAIWERHTAHLQYDDESTTDDE